MVITHPDFSGFPETTQVEIYIASRPCTACDLSSWRQPTVLDTVVRNKKHRIGSRKANEDEVAIGHSTA